jgi:hypothetical protein
MAAITSPTAESTATAEAIISNNTSRGASISREVSSGRAQQQQIASNFASQEVSNVVFLKKFLFRMKYQL